MAEQRKFVPADKAEVEEMKTIPWSQLAILAMERADHYDHLRSEATMAWNLLQEMMRQVVPQKLEDEGLQNITVKMPDGVNRRFQIADKMSVSTPKENRQLLYEWLEAQDAMELITSTVNASTLSSFVKERMKQGEETPVDICVISTYTLASLVKA